MKNRAAYALPGHDGPWRRITKTFRLAQITAVVILALSFDLSASVFSQTITFSGKEVPLQKAFEAIKKQTGLFVFYDQKMLEDAKPVTIDVKDAPLDNFLHQLLRNQPLDFIIKGRTVFISARTNVALPVVLTTTPAAIAPPVGGVIKGADGQPLVGANVMIKGTSRGTTTDADGHFSIDVKTGEVLVISSVGFEKKEITIRDASSLSLVLNVSNSPLDQVQIIAYGTQRKADVTGSVTSIGANEIKDIPVAQIAQKLQGKTPGVEINQTTGIPGKGMSIRIRGAASISGSSQPLYVVDGFPIVGDISGINPDEIESITILKDASSTALYGSRASQGVVLVETKKAKNGTNNLSFNSFYGVQQVPKRGRPDMMNAQEFAQYENDIYTDEIASGAATSIPPEYQNPSQYAGKGTDWYGILLRDAPIQNYSVTMSSNKEKTSTTATLGYMNQEGVMLNSNYKRYSFRINSEYKFNSHITAGLSVAPTYGMNATPNSDGNIFSGGIIQGAITTSPIAPAVNPDGSLPLQATSAGLFPNPNWYRVVQEVKNNNKTGNILSNAYLNVEILKDLVFKTSVNVQYTNSQSNFFSPSTAGALFAPPPRPATASNTNSTYYTWLTENTLSYKHSFGDHHLEALAGYTAQKYHMDYGMVTGTNFPNDRLPSLNNASTYTVNYDPTQNLQEWALVSLISRINYNYKGKYLLSASFRRDGSSRFAENTKYGNFPAISAGWNVSDESFMSEVPLISNLKLRAGYGLNGNFDIGNYTYSANTINTNYAAGNNLIPGTSIGNIGNRNLSWEKSNQLDIGTDIGLLNNRIAFTYDYFLKYTTNMLLDIDVPDESGFASATGNVGKFRFTGHEFSVTSRNMIGPLKWTTNFNITFIRDKVINLGPYKDNLPRRDAHGPAITAVGQPISMFYGYTYLGVFKTQQDFDSYPHLPRNMVGSAKLEDRNGDGQISEADEGIIGNPNPKFTYGMTNTFSYKNWDLNIVMSGSYGNQIMNRTYEYTRNLDGVFNVTKDVAHRWKSLSDPGNGIIPKTQSGGSERETNTLWINSGSYLTVKNVTLGYSLPLHTNNIIRGLRVYGSIQQAWVITHYNGANPEVNDSGLYGANNSLIQGVDYTSYPVPRTMSLGLNVNFK